MASGARASKRRRTTSMQSLSPLSASGAAQAIAKILKPLGKPEIQDYGRRVIQGAAPCFGVKAPERRAATKKIVDDLVKRATPTLVVKVMDELYCYPEREMHYTAIDVMKRTQRVWSRPSRENNAKSAEAMRDCLVRCVRVAPWWDTIDFLSSQGIGPLALGFPEVVDDLLTEWMNAESVWERRAVVLYQLRYKDNTDEERLFHVLRTRAMDDEFWIQKAIGWALRTYKRSAPDSVQSFIEKERTRLRPLSIREAQK